MNTNRLKSLTHGWRALVAVAVMGMAVLGSAQDYSTLQGTNQRIGTNSGAALSSPGRALLRWFAPFLSGGDIVSLIRNNTAAETATTGVWLTPAQIDETGNAYNVVTGSTPEPDLTTGADVPAGTAPGYAYAFTVPAGQGTDPTVKNFVADELRVFEWTVQPANLTHRTARNYALYAWLPLGPTGDGGGGLLFTQRYFVYEIIYAGGRRWVDVVDTYAAGGGWVRLGGGGRSTNRLYDYNGVDPIRIRLYNTVPRLAGHENDVVNGPLSNWLGVFTDVPYTSVVYADAVMAVPVTGDFAATPIVSQLDPALPGLGSHAVYARNDYTVGVVNNQTVTAVSGVVTSVEHNTGVVRWSYSPLAESPTLTVSQDNNSAGVTPQPPFAASTAEPGYQGTNYHSAAIVNTLGTESVMRYQPTLVDGVYDIYAYCPGTRGTETLGQAVEVRITEGSNPTVTYSFNQDTARGWVRIGTRRFTHQGSIGEDLRVEISNYSPNAGDLGLTAYSDAIRFVGAANLSITSTPVHVKANVIPTNGGVPTPTSVVLIATEDGRLTLVDAVGNGDGTTRAYWTYPSTPDPDNPGWTDPNAVPTEDGGVATMPLGFDLSSALVQNIGGADYLFIATRNGRVYCIEMAGRGDMDFARRLPGTTRRVWSYPNDFPAIAQRTSLGAFTGSLTYADTGSGPTIYAPTAQGRLYALEALPAGPNPNKVTNVRWAFPALNQPTLGTIYMTPLVAGNTVFFGTGVKADDDRGRFYALNANNGNLQWQFNGTTAWDTAGGGATFINADDFVAGPAFGTAGQLGGGMPDTIFVMNENRWLTALNATDGTLLWTTDELASTIIGNLTLTTIDAFTGGGGGARANTPLVMAPTVDGRFTGLFARAGVGFGATNRFGTKRAWEYVSAGGPLYSSMSVGRNMMYGADSAGYVYAFNNDGNGSDQDVNGPGQRTIVENDDSDPNVENFRDAKIAFVTKDTFQRLRLAVGDANHYSYPQATNPATLISRQQFDWGEYLYVLVYDLPYLITNTQTGSSVPPPVVNYQFSVEGAAFRNLSVEVRQFRAPNTSPFGPDGSTRLDGYAILAFPIQGSGSNALPPGRANVSVSVSTSGVTDPPRQVNIGLNPLNSRREFGISNPIGLAIIAGDPLRHIGNVVDPSDPGRQANGSPNIPATGQREDRLTATTGVVSHAQSGSTDVNLIDTSLMTLLRGPGRGVDNVRFNRNGLNWQGGQAAVTKRIIDIPFYSAFYGSGKGMEDYPINFPNTSLDYPDIEEERIKVVKDIFGNAENPVFGPMSLNPPTNVVESALPFPTRDLSLTVLTLTVDVPRFQPPNRTQALDSANAAVDAGYYGRMNVFVDSDGSGTLTRGGGRREAFRAFWLGSSVGVDNSFLIETPTIDFGNLASGTGYSPLAPNVAGSNYTPFPSPTVPLGLTYNRSLFPYTDLFKPITIRNEGNVNLINLRLAKSYNYGGPLIPWEIFSANDHERVWLNGSLNLHATFDEQFSLTPVPVLQKARVGDSSGTTFSDIPVVRDNPNINSTAGFLFTPGIGGFPDVAREVLTKGPRIGISIPLGFPSTQLSQIIRIIEDTNGDESLPLDGGDNGLENYADPTVSIRGTVRETRLTNNFTPRTAPMIDSLTTTTVGNEQYQLANSQPAAMRALRGHLLTIFTSDRFGQGAGAGFNKTQPATPEDNPETRLYFSSLAGTIPGAASPLSDLNGFAAADTSIWPNGRWWRQEVADYPNLPAATLFPGDPVVAGTMKFGAPSLPSSGAVSPFTGVANPFAYVAFLGTAQKQGTERYNDNRIFLSQVTIGGAGALTVTDPISNPNDTLMPKGKPSIVQAGRNASVFWSIAGTGQSGLQYATTDGVVWSPTRTIDVGPGFENVSAPHAVGRVYRGVGAPGTPANGQNMIELTFTGKLRGMPAPDIYLGRLVANGAGIATGQTFFPTIQNEFLVADREVGTFRSSGVSWNRRGTTELWYSLNGAAPVNIEVPNTRQQDQSTGIWTFDTTLGGKAYLDPNLGTVRLANTLPSRGGQLFLTYQPRFLRVSSGGAAYNSPSLMFDNRLIGELSYWATAANTAINPNVDVVRSSRFIFTYGRAVSGNQVARPFMQTVRAGIQLPSSIATNPDGTLVGLTVTGATSYYQVDPANGRLYFTDADENRTITVTYTGFNDAGVPVAYPNPSYPNTSYRTGLLSERNEAPIPVDQAVNESQLATFLDPFEGTLANRRPGLMWLFWTSTRGGSPDVYFQTLAPRFTPRARGN
ncbi:MAG: PQQ-binding-like beta-propeller repeat protein [Methanoregulaceae archaeon]|nr:PQQ-binding-like beta-propeller repeat protein [Methanoregulaceae archaeon]